MDITNDIEREGNGREHKNWVGVHSTRACEVRTNEA